MCRVGPNVDGVSGLGPGLHSNPSCKCAMWASTRRGRGAEEVRIHPHPRASTRIQAKPA